MKRWSALVLALALVVAAGCEKNPDGGSEGGNHGRAFLSIGTAPPGGAFFVVGGAIGEVLNEFKGENRWEFTSEATKGSQENIRRLVRGELDLALANSAISYFAVRGEGAWQQPYEVRAVATLAPNVALFITPESSGVQSIADLAGKRVVIGPAGAGFEYFVGPILEAHGLTYDSMDVLHAPQAGAVDLLADGAADAAFLGGAVPTASITQAAAGQSIHYIPFDGAAKEGLVNDYLFFRPATIPSGTYRGLDAEYAGLDVGSMHLITSADESEETVYQLTKTLYEQREEVAKKHPAGRAINPNNVVRDTGTPFHPGAIRYYKEAGIWPEGRDG